MRKLHNWQDWIYPKYSWHKERNKTTEGSSSAKFNVAGLESKHYSPSTPFSSYSLCRFPQWLKVALGIIRWWAIQPGCTAQSSSHSSHSWLFMSVSQADDLCETLLCLLLSLSVSFSPLISCMSFNFNQMTGHTFKRQSQRQKIKPSAWKKSSSQVKERGPTKAFVERITAECLREGKLWGRWSCR